MSCVNDHVMRKHKKCIYKTNVTVTSFKDNSFLTSLETRYS